LNGTTAPATWRDGNGNAITPHGYRSSFKDWASEATSYSNETSEMALSHAVGDKVEALAAFAKGTIRLTYHAT
jgi:hypothetical protein